ncbi:MAG: hypothetical protein LPJ89_01505 [Hymenobacteraceae bacterium]|nr:hypothetical protein [Hymenobacteraceae bacterium]MDX5396477.1 hypothetical protein [Hymenobacteraceae bacterium]MDX5442439.1 hypothetical protein [Hymenobacteraceae bacterium]MDX5512538.1 hypothetical protein [Hymenobacteraceae bacterium]
MKKYLVGLLLLLAQKGICCSCSGSNEYANMERSIEWWNSYEFIFKAVIDSTVAENWAYNRVYLTATKVYKGDVPEKLNFLTEGSFSSCGWNLEKKIGYEFIMYGVSDEDGNIRSHFCHGSKMLMNKKMIDSLQINPRLAVIYLQEREFLRDIENSKNKKVKTYYSNGNLTGVGRLKNYQPVGYWEYLSFDGKLIAKGNYNNYKKNGEWTEYIYHHKEVKSNSEEPSYEWVYQGYIKGQYLNGEKVGEWITYDQGGNPQ